MHKSIQNFYPLVSPLLQYRHNVTSQQGEDGIIDRIMSVLSPVNRYCVEFGAWDGKNHSNCYNLIMNKNWAGVMIEPNPERYEQLTETYRGCSAVKTVNKFVQCDGPDTLDNILMDCGAPSEPGLISIDIDGNDYHVWESLVAFRPELLVIEFNPTIPNDVIFIQDKSFEINHGCSLLALVILGKKKGYELAVCTEWNAFFVKEGKAAALGVENTSHLALYTPQLDGRIFQGMDHSIHVVGMDCLFWGGRALTSEDFQVLSKSERVWKDAQNSDRIKAQERFNEALTHHQAGRLADAAVFYALAIDLKPDHMEAISNRGVALFGLGFPEEAVACYRRAISLNPQFADTHNNLGVALAHMECFAEAASSFQRAAELNPGHADARNNLELAMAALSQKRP